jgi:hypothetical protein
MVVESKFKFEDYFIDDNDDGYIVGAWNQTFTLEIDYYHLCTQNVLCFQII